ncbi:MAG: CbiX/SirB N-terminal domain-containing protein [Nitrospinota bacterium]|nr:CbiX/SirB N-terminal domain-containing protein [Nitrospinota bacterium]
MSNLKYGIVLVGHGGLPSDCPDELISKLKRLESQRRKNGLPMSNEEIELDYVIRNWPRTPETDPYQAGLEAVAKSLQSRLNGARLEIAYNEFCAPTLKEAVGSLINEGFADITVISTMFTPGGSHSEIEIPEEVSELNKILPNVNVNFAWPFDLEHVGKFLSEHIELHRKDIKCESSKT